MYKTLYRKYRPTTFDETVGQDIIIKTIKNAIKNNKLVHAYLFTGPRGTGKTSVAKIIAKTINCENLLENITPCNKCVNCTQYNNNQLIDVIEIDAASNNGVDEIRELKNNVNLVPALGKYKIYIIDEVHMLTTGAFNALLKTLEEPPKNIIFILATTEPHKIPNTILSRCQRFDFKKISDNKIIERIKFIVTKEKINIKEEAIIEIARLSDGGMRDALSILDQALAYCEDEITLESIHEINGTLPQEEIKKLVDNIIEKNEIEILKIIDDYDNAGKNFIKLSEEIILFLRNCLIYNTAIEYFKKNNINYDIYSDISKKLSSEKIIYLIEKFNNLIFEMKKYNKTKILFEVNLLSLLEIKQNIDIVKPIKKEESVKNTQNKKIEKNKKKIKINNEILEQIKNIRINNTLSKFNKKDLLKHKNNIEDIRIYLMNPDYSDCVSIILDGELKAYGDNNYIFVYENDNLSREFNENIIKIDELFSKINNCKCRTISTYVDDWNKIKEEFNGKRKKFEYQEEPLELISNLILEENNNELEEDFDDIIQYN